MVLHAPGRAGAFDSGLAIRTMTLPDRFIDHASPDDMYAAAGLTRHDMATQARRAIGLESKVVSLHRA